MDELTNYEVNFVYPYDKPIVKNVIVSKSMFSQQLAV